MKLDSPTKRFSTLLTWAVLSVLLSVVTINETKAQETPLQTASISPVQARQSFQWLANQMIRHIPPTITGDDDWGNTKEVWAGVRVRRDGWKLKTNRRKKELRHGRWVQYRINLPHLAKPTMANETIDESVEIRSVTPDLHRWRIEAAARTPADFSVRVERWNLGFQLYSIEISGKMTLSLTTILTLAVQPDWSEVPPAMQLNADIEQAALKIERFEVERISKIGGDVAEEIGDLAEHTIGKVWMRKENERLASRLNHAISKNHDDLRWSMSDWITGLTLGADGTPMEPNAGRLAP
ncbi:hypothetical protein [Neorhodopirellula pilleata]|uniref:Uncharacterized protein n=1 Tax=Neorhodopirellula pilleata TaxID=2714738 RepID=A0A5C6AX31_9BACT|nr:hypothetical protein [Neorhodopirellula pilleata]TWU03592.1 hypothetical protein Pla100_05200 [Neorhodopirellula pilleata]